MSSSTLTTNDYGKGVLWYRIQHDVQAVIELGSNESGSHRIIDASREVTQPPTDYEYAIDVFVTLREDHDESAMSSTAREQVPEMFHELGITKLQRHIKS